MAKKRPRTDAERRLRQCERLGRLLRILQLISGKGRWDVDGLAQELECSRRTVYRMLQTLSMAGVPWYFDDQARAYRIRPGYRFPIAQVDVSSPLPKSALDPPVLQFLDELIATIAGLKEELAALQSSASKLRGTGHGNGNGN